MAAERVNSPGHPDRSTPHNTPVAEPVNKDANGDGPLRDHELFHTFQWAAAGGLPFAALYWAEYAKVGECNRFEEAADFAAGDYE